MRSGVPVLFFATRFSLANLEALGEDTVVFG
jgi:hypothetical protein